MYLNDMNFCPRCGNPLTTTVIHSHERRTCTDTRCGFTFWNNPVPVVAAIAVQAGHVMLVRSHGWPQGWYGLVTGFLERGEVPEHAALREVQEELGLEGNLEGFVGHYYFPRRNQVIAAYHVSLPPGEVVLEAEELEAYKRVAVERVQPWDSATGHALRDWLRSQGIVREVVPRPRPPKAG